MLCDEELNYCEKNHNTCQNGGKCISLTRDDGDFICECPSGFRGRNCEVIPMYLQTTTSPNFIPILTNTTITTTTTQPTSTTTEKVMVVEAKRPSSEKPPIDDLLLDNFSSEDINNEAKK